MKLEQSDLDGVVTWTLLRAARNIERKFTDVIMSYGLSSVQFGVLVQLAAGDSLTRAELARVIMVRPQSIAGAIDGMLERGLIALVGTSGKGRPNPAVLTDKGHAMIDEVWPSFVHASRAANLGITESEASALNTTLHQLRQL